MSEVSEEIAKFIRLPLLSPEELSRIENENKDHFIPVCAFRFPFIAPATYIPQHS